MMADHLNLGDAPLEDPAEDVLDHARWAQQLAKMIATGHFANGYVIAVTGEWGCGKSSCMNFVQHYLGHPPKRGGWAAVETIRFNPWWFDPDDKLADRFFEQFQASLAESTRVSSGLKQAINALFEALRRRKGHGSPRSIARLKDAVRRCARPDGNSQPERVLMVIDDLDRLSTSEIREVFRLVKSVADFPGIVYVLCYDVDVVRTSLDDVIANQKGGAYLEKLVQMSLPVPTPTPSARRRLFDSRIERHAEQADAEGLFSSVRMDEMFSKGLADLLQTPRRVKRLFDVVDARYPGLSADVDLADFVGLMALRESVPKAYDHIRQRPDDFQGGGLARFLAGDNWVEAVEGRVETWSSELPEATAAATKHVLRSLFPGFPKVPMGMPDPSAGERYRFRCNTRSLRRALALDLEPEGLGRADCRRLVDPSRKLLTDWILSNEPGDSWVAQAYELQWYLKHGEDSFDQETRMFIIRAFFRSGEVGWGRFGGEMGVPIPLFQEWLAKAESPSSVARLCHESSGSWCRKLSLAACWAHGLYTPRGDESSAEYAARHPKLGSREDAEQLRQVYLDRMKSAPSSELRLLYKPSEHIYAHLWLDGEDGMCRFATSFANEEGVVSFLQWFIPHEQNGVPQWKLDDGVHVGNGQRYFADLLRVLPDLPQRLSGLAPDGPTGDTRELVKRLRAWLARSAGHA